MPSEGHPQLLRGRSEEPREDGRSERPEEGMSVIRVIQRGGHGGGERPFGWFPSRPR